MKVEDGDRPRYATSLDVSRTLTDHVIDTALTKVKVEIAPDCVTVEFEVLEICRG